MGVTIVPLRLSDEVPFEQRLLDVYKKTPTSRKGPFLRQLLELGMAALEAQQAGYSLVAPEASVLTPASSVGKVVSIARPPAPAPAAPQPSAQPEGGDGNEGGETAAPIKAAGVLKDFFVTGKTS